LGHRHLGEHRALRFAKDVAPLRMRMRAIAQ
jgi:hypothetical protein